MPTRCRYFTDRCTGIYLETIGNYLPESSAGTYILRLIKQCVQVATPGMALLGEAIVAPKEIMKYFGTGIIHSQGM